MTESNPRVALPVGELLGKAWAIFSGNVAPFLGGVVITGIIVALGNQLLYIVGSLLAGPLALGLYKMALDALRGRTPILSDLFVAFQDPNLFIMALLVNVLVSLFSLIGFILLIVPGILVAALYLPTFCVLVDDKSDFWTAMETSRKMVMDNFGAWVIFTLALIGVNLVGFLLLIVGLLVTMPVSIIAVAEAYRRQRGDTVTVAAQGVDTAPPPPPGE
ncbi:MAG: hypothetical protein ACLFTT_00185 [Candidatus Hydrogenedentota bacterium]